MSSRREMKRESIMPSAVDRKSSEDWILIMSDALIWPLISSVLTCSFRSHPNVFLVPLCISHFPTSFCLFPQTPFKPSPPVLWITAVDGCGARSLKQKPFCKGKVSRQRKP